MLQLNAFSIGLVAFMASVVLLAFMAASVVIALEIVLRVPINAVVIRFWTASHEINGNRSGRFPAHRALLRWINFPYRELTGIISAAIQLEIPLLEGTDPNGIVFSENPVRQFLAEVGSRIVFDHPFIFIKLSNDARFAAEHPAEGYRDKKSSVEIAEFALAEIALDHLQGTLAMSWTIVTYCTSVLIIFITFQIIQMSMDSNARFNLHHYFVTLPLILLIATLFTPLFRDLLVRLIRS